MSKAVQRRRGTTAEHTTFTGALGELTVDTTKDTIVVHDGAVAGGYPLARENLSNVPSGTITSTMIADGTIVDADVNASAAIVDTKLATIATTGKVSNSATTATDANTASAIVARDGSGNFTAGTITAALTGAASSNVLKAGDTMTGPLAVTAGTAALPAITPSGDPNTGIYSPGADQVAISTNGTERLSINSAGTTTLTSAASTAPFIAKINTTDVARIDSSGRLLVGTSTARIAGSGSEASLQIEAPQSGQGKVSIIQNASGNFSPARLVLGKSNNTGIGGNTIVQSDGYLGVIEFAGADGTDLVSTAALIRGEVDGTPGANDMPGRLVFSTTADGSASPTERMRISQDGAVKIAGNNFQIATSKTPASATATGTVGQIAWDASYIYVCTATDTWKRTAIATW